MIIKAKIIIGLRSGWTWRWRHTWCTWLVVLVRNKMKDLVFATWQIWQLFWGFHLLGFIECNPGRFPGGFQPLPDHPPANIHQPKFRMPGAWRSHLLAWNPQETSTQNHPFFCGLPWYLGFFGDSKSQRSKFLGPIPSKKNPWMVSIGNLSNEKKIWLVRVYRGLYYPVLYRDYNNPIKGLVVAHLFLLGKTAIGFVGFLNARCILNSRESSAAEIFWVHPGGFGTLKRTASWPWKFDNTPLQLRWHLKTDGWKMCFPFWGVSAYFQRQTVSFRECKCPKNFRWWVLLAACICMWICFFCTQKNRFVFFLQGQSVFILLLGKKIRNLDSNDTLTPEKQIAGNSFFCEVSRD